jgi:hypothetical protein
MPGAFPYRRAVEEAGSYKQSKLYYSNQPFSSRFHVLKLDGEIMLKCHYCEREVKRDEAGIT